MKKIIVSLVILSASLVALVAANHAALSSRIAFRGYAIASERFPAFLVPREVDCYRLWKEKGVRGRVVVHLGRYLHFVEPAQAEPLNIPDIVKSHSRFDDAGTSYRDFLWAAMQTNIAREIITVIPREDFKKRFGLKDDLSAQRDVTTHEYGSPRVFSVRLPSGSEPVLLNIDASFFASRTPAELLDDLMKSPLRADLVTVCLAEDNPDVTDLERQKARDFIARLSAHAGISDYASPVRP